MPNDYEIAHQARKKAATQDEKDEAAYNAYQDGSEPGMAHPAMRGISYGSKPIINGVSQARGVVDRNVITPEDITPVVNKPKLTRT